jgi:hypothetical protein
MSDSKLYIFFNPKLAAFVKQVSTAYLFMSTAHIFDYL